MIPSRIRRLLLLSVGILALGLGIAGIFLPLLPTTPFLLAAAACFVRSSERMYRWLMGHRWFGPLIRNYRHHRAITKRNKIVTLTLLWCTIGYTAFGIVQGWLLRSLLLLIAAGVSIHVLSLRTLTKEMVASRPEDDDEE
jgi:uncharacterized membrane protein YbaN (DUF454 family)